MRKLWILLLLPALLAMAPAVGHADSDGNGKTCVDRSQMIKTLVENYDEQLAEVHEIKGKGLLEFHVSPTEGTWTAILTNSKGVSCVVATGDGINPGNYEDLEPGFDV